MQVLTLIFFSIFLQVVSSVGNQSYETCESSEWLLVNLNDVPETESNSNALKALSYSCLSTVSIDFPSGSLIELAVYVQAASNRTRLEITLVQEDRNDSVMYYEYSTSSEDFESKWNTISLPPVSEEMTGYVMLRGYVEDDDLILVESIRNAYDNSDILHINQDNDENNESRSNGDNNSDNENGNNQGSNGEGNDGGNEGDNDGNNDGDNYSGSGDSNESKIGDSNDSGNEGDYVGDNDGDDYSGSGDSNEIEIGDGNDSGNESDNDGENGDNNDGDNGDNNDGDNDVDNEVDNNGDNDGDNGSGTDSDNNDANGGNGTESVEIEEAPVENGEHTSFWNYWTIALVTLGVAVAVGLIITGAYHLGKIKGRDQATDVEIDNIEAPRVIPRAKGFRFSPYQGFGRNYTNRAFSEES